MPYGCQYPKRRNEDHTTLIIVSPIYDKFSLPTLDCNRFFPNASFEAHQTHTSVFPVYCSLLNIVSMSILIHIIRKLREGV